MTHYKFKVTSLQKDSQGNQQPFTVKVKAVDVSIALLEAQEAVKTQGLNPELFTYWLAGRTRGDIAPVNATDEHKFNNSKEV